MSSDSIVFVEAGKYDYNLAPGFFDEVIREVNLTILNKINCALPKHLFLLHNGSVLLTTSSVADYETNESALQKVQAAREGLDLQTIVDDCLYPETDLSSEKACKAHHPSNACKPTLAELIDILSELAR